MKIMNKKLIKAIDNYNIDCKMRDEEEYCSSYLKYRISRALFLILYYMYHPND